jgi:hypothetical protein
MKHLVFLISLTAILVWNLSCTKESLEKEAPSSIVYTECGNYVTIEYDDNRNGAGEILFLHSLSNTNVLLGVSPRKETIYNQSKIHYIKFEPTGGSAFNYNGIFHWPYLAEFKWMNDSVSYEFVSVGYTNGQSFVHFPEITKNLLFNNHPAGKITYVYGRSMKTINVLRDSKINLSLIDVYYDNDLEDGLAPILSAHLYPVHRGTNVFTPTHKY